MNYEIIDFHTHPFLKNKQNICKHNEYMNITPDSFKSYMEALGIARVCGSVIYSGNNSLEKMLENNNDALALKEKYGDFYIPGFHVNPFYKKESMEEIERMHKKGINLVGELVPYIDGWNDYSMKDFDEILTLLEEYNMVVSFHSGGEDSMDKMVKNHKNLVFVAAHPGEYKEFMRHLERMKMNENYYLDISGTGVFRHGLIRHAIDDFGKERIIFGSDFPVCNPASYLGAVIMDISISDTEKEYILSKNAKKLLTIK